MTADRNAGVLVVYPHGTDRPGIEIQTRDGFVARCVSAIANSDQSGCIPDAMQAAHRLNVFGPRVGGLRMSPQITPLTARAAAIVAAHPDREPIPLLREHGLMIYSAAHLHTVRVVARALTLDREGDIPPAWTPIGDAAASALEQIVQSRAGESP
jgi:hypothetical protein